MFRFDLFKYSVGFYGHDSESTSFLGQNTSEYSFEILDFVTKRQFLNPELIDQEKITLFNLNIGDLSLLLVNTNVSIEGRRKDAGRSFDLTLRKLNKEKKTTGHTTDDDVELLWEQMDALTLYTVLCIFEAAKKNKKWISEYRKLLTAHAKNDLSEIHRLEKEIIRPVDATIAFNQQIAHHYDANNVRYYLRSFLDVLILEYHHIVGNHKNIKICANCGSLFIPLIRSDEIYCDNILKNGKSCKQLGYENKVNSDEFLKTYRKIYKTQNARKQRNKKNIPDVEERFKKWHIYAKDQLKLCQSGNISVNEMSKRISDDSWLKEGITNGDDNQKK